MIPAASGWAGTIPLPSGWDEMIPLAWARDGMFTLAPWRGKFAAEFPGFSFTQSNLSKHTIGFRFFSGMSALRARSFDFIRRLTQ